MKVGIIGLGLIGGSIGLALRSSELSSNIEQIIGISRREQTLGLARQLGVVDDGDSEERSGEKALEKLADADLIFLCTPIHLILPKLRELSAHLKKGAIVTDVASVKGPIMSEAAKIMPKGTFFVGAHPMAGKEKAKLEHAEAGLFQNRPWIFISKGNTRAINKVKEIAAALGGKVMEMDAKKHDLAVAAVSHVPLAVAAALVNSVAEASLAQAEMKEAASSGFRDTTRVASGEVELGREMFLTNPKPILKQLKAFKSNLKRLESAIKSGNAKEIEAVLAEAKQFRDSLPL